MRNRIKGNRKGKKGIGERRKGGKRIKDWGEGERREKRGVS